MADNAPLALTLGPAGGGSPFWGLNDSGLSSNQGPLFATDAWDTFWLGTRQLPGECSVKPGSVARLELNKKKGKGLDGARLTLAGYDPREFQVEVQIATAEQWAELQDVIDVYWRIPGKTSNLSQIAISVGHPNLAWLKIYTAVLVGITPMTDGKVEGTMVTTLTFQEAPPVSKKNVTKTAGPPAAPAEDERQPASSLLSSSAPPPPSSIPANMSTSGPPLQSRGP